MSRGRLWRWVLLPALGVAVIVVLARWPVQTRQGVDFAVSTSTLPLYVKALEFVQRDAGYRRLALGIAGDRTSGEARTLAVFEWTRENIRDTPEGFPIVDDHVWHIIVRGYGEDDQKADVFTTLATYAGAPSYWALSTDASHELPLSFSWIDRRWIVFDVANGLAFRNARGGLAAAEEIAADPQIVAGLAAGRVYRDRPYAAYFEGFQPPIPSEVLRPEMQMLWPRVMYRAKRMVGFGRREWER